MDYTKIGVFYLPSESYDNGFCHKGPGQEGEVLIYRLLSESTVEKFGSTVRSEYLTHSIINSYKFLGDFIRALTPRRVRKVSTLLVGNTKFHRHQGLMKEDIRLLMVTHDTSKIRRKVFPPLTQSSSTSLNRF